MADDNESKPSIEIALKISKATTGMLDVLGSWALDFDQESTALHNAQNAHRVSLKTGRKEK